ncbi:MAG: multidrug effflux MFS transporter [Magnetococcales bacterium]|nr:multidrug effflux MFS transporter [Magnetococcales bacterium]
MNAHTSVPDNAVKPDRLLLAVLIIITALGPASTQVFLPTLPAVQAAFGASPGIAQLGLSLPMMAMAFSDLGYGPWSDRVGRRPVLLAGLIAFIAGNLVCLFAPNIWILVAGRILQDCGGSVGIVLSRAIALDVYGKEKAGSVISMTLMAMAVGPMLGPLAGGLISDAFGWRAIFIFMGALGVVIVVFVLFRFTETHRPRSDQATTGSIWRPFLTLLRSPTFNAFAWHSAFVWGMFMAFIGAAPYVMQNVFGKAPTEFGLWLIPAAFGYIGGNGLSAAISAKLGPERMVWIGAMVVLASVMLLTALMMLGFWTPLALFIPASVAAFGAGIAIPNAQAEAVDAVEDASGSASGLIGFMLMIMGAAAAQLVGMLQGGTPYPMAWVMLGLAAMAMAALMIPRSKR